MQRLYKWATAQHNNDTLYLFLGANKGHIVDKLVLRTHAVIWNPHLLSRYYNDVWEYDPETLTWTYIETKGKQPAARGGCQLAIHEDILYVFGGHSIVRDKSGEQDKVHDDVWILDFKTKEVLPTCHLFLLHGALKVQLIKSQDSWAAAKHRLWNNFIAT